MRLWLDDVRVLPRVVGDAPTEPVRVAAVGADTSHDGRELDAAGDVAAASGATTAVGPASGARPQTSQ